MRKSLGLYKTNLLGVGRRIAWEFYSEEILCLLRFSLFHLVLCIRIDEVNSWQFIHTDSMLRISILSDSFIVSDQKNFERKTPV